MDRRNLIAAGLLGGAVALASGPVARSKPREPAPPGWKAAWDAAAGGFRRDLAAEGVVGGAAAFCHDGALLGFEPYGFQELATRRPIDIETIYHWASITKTFTAIAFMQLRDRGLVSPDEPAVKYCPELAAVHDPFGRIDQITLAHLLSHSSGLRASTFPWGGDKPWEPHEPAQWSTIADMMPYTEIEFQPGSKYSYSNLGMSLIGRVIEAVSGDIYQQYVIKNVLMPLDMSRTYFDQTPYFLLPHRSHSYFVDAGAVTDNGAEVLTGATVANGGLNAPIGDFVKYTSFLLGLGDAKRNAIVLSAKTLQEMCTPRLPAEKLGEDQVYIGLGFFVVDHKLANGRMTRYAGHGGFQIAFHTDFQVNFDSGCAFMAGVNSVGRHVPSPWSKDYVAAAFTSLVPLFSR